MPKRKNEHIHNTHMLLPIQLWKALKKRAREVGRTVTDLVVLAIESSLTKKEK